MNLCILVTLVANLAIILGEYWTARVQKGVRCTEVFTISKTSTEINCFRNCLKTSRCCSVNYFDEQNSCEFCTAGSTVKITKDSRYTYVGYTKHQENREDKDHINEHPCHSCAEIFSNVQFTVNTTEEGGIKTFTCKNNTEAETTLKEATCKVSKNQWSSTEFTCKSTGCYDNKEDYNGTISTLTNGGTCLRWDDPKAYLNVLPDKYFTADGKSKSAAQNYCRYPSLEGAEKYFHKAPFLFCSPEDLLIEKAMCAVRSCQSTNLDDCGTPPSLPFPAVRSYPVVGDVFLTNYKCASYSGDNPTAYCPVSRCIGQNNWTDLNISCSRQDCYEGGHHDSYTGKRFCTESGRICQAWDSNEVHSHSYSHGNEPEKNRNYCRGTSGMTPWCYTMDPELRWESCNVPKC